MMDQKNGLYFHSRNIQGVINMTREDMNDPRPREDWMTEELEAMLWKIARDGTISCFHAQKFAVDEKIAMNQMKALLDVLKIKVVRCQLGCF
jgi:hypothetical protein